MSAAHAALEMRPEAIKSLRVRVALPPLFAAMIHRVMLIADPAKRALTGSFIGADGAALGNILFDQREWRLVLRIRHNVGHQITATLHHANTVTLLSVLPGRPIFAPVCLRPPI